MAIQKKGDNKMKNTNYVPVHNANIPKRNTMPILKNAISRNGLMISTDLECTLFTPSVLPEGVYKIVGKNFVSSPDDILAFPPTTGIIENFNRSISITAGPELLRELIEAVKYCSKELSRPIFTGINLEISPGTVKIAATDGKCIFQKTLKVETTGVNEGETESSIIGVKQFDLIKRVKPDRLTIYLESDRSMAVAGNIQVISHSIVGRYPQYSRAIQNKMEKVIKINRKDWLSAIKELLPFAKGLDIPRLQIDIDELTVKNYEEGIELTIPVNADISETATFGVSTLDNMVLLMPLRQYMRNEKGELTNKALPGSKEFKLDVNIKFLDRILRSLQSDYVNVLYLTGSDGLAIVEV